jgi:hypothetical protein
MSINIIVQLLSDNTTIHNMYSKMFCRIIANISSVLTDTSSGVKACDANDLL